MLTLMDYFSPADRRILPLPFMLISTTHFQVDG